MNLFNVNKYFRKKHSKLKKNAVYTVQLYNKTTLTQLFCFGDNEKPRAFLIIAVKVLLNFLRS